MTMSKGDYRLETTIQGFPRKVTHVWRDAVDRALEERDELGVHVPEDFKVSVGLYQSDSTAAARGRVRGKNVLW